MSQTISSYRDLNLGDVVKNSAGAPLYVRKVGPVVDEIWPDAALLHGLFSPSSSDLDVILARSAIYVTDEGTQYTFANYQLTKENPADFRGWKYAEPNGQMHVLE